MTEGSASWLRLRKILACFTMALTAFTYNYQHRIKCFCYFKNYQLRTKDCDRRRLRAFHQSPFADLADPMPVEEVRKHEDDASTATPYLSSSSQPYCMTQRATRWSVAFSWSALHLRYGWYSFQPATGGCLVYDSQNPARSWRNTTELTYFWTPTNNRLPFTISMTLLLRRIHPRTYVLPTCVETCV